VFEHLDPRSPTPLYEQIAARLRLAVASGELRPGETLPSVRQLAARLRVNPATVVQAYRDLEGEGFVDMKQGAGTFVREVAADRRSAERTKQAGRLVRQLLQEAGQLGVTTHELTEAIRRELGAKVA
jgi:GntR family transcriptional regulator